MPTEHLLRAFDLKTGAKIAETRIRLNSNFNVPTMSNWVTVDSDGKTATLRIQETGRTLVYRWPFVEGKAATPLPAESTSEFNSSYAIVGDRLIVNHPDRSPATIAAAMSIASAVGQFGGLPVLPQLAGVADAKKIPWPLPNTVRYVVRIWDINTHKLIAPPEPSDASASVHSSEKYGKAIIAYQNYPNLRAVIWDVKTGQKLETISAMFRLLSPDGRFAIFSSSKVVGGRYVNGTHLLDLSTMKTRVLCEHADNKEYRFSPDSRYAVIWSQFLASPGDRGTRVQVFDLHQPDSHWTPAESFALPAVELSPDGRSIGILDRAVPNQMHLYSLADGKKLQTITLRRGNYRADLADLGELPRITFSPDGAHIAVNVADQVSLGNIDRARLHTALARSGHFGVVSGVAASPDGSFLASAGADRTVCFWRSRDGKYLGMLDEGGLGQWFGGPNPGAVRRVVFSPRGNLIALRKESGEICVWKWSRPAEEDAEITAEFLWSNTRTPGGPLAFNPDGTLLAAAESNGSVRLFDPQTGQIAHWLTAPAASSAVQALTFTPDGKYLAAAPARLSCCGTSPRARRT